MYLSVLYWLYLTKYDKKVISFFRDQSSVTSALPVSRDVLHLQVLFLKLIKFNLLSHTHDLEGRHGLLMLELREQNLCKYLKKHK